MFCLGRLDYNIFILKDNHVLALQPTAALEMTIVFIYIIAIFVTIPSHQWPDMKHTHTLSSHTSLSNLAIFTLWVQER